MLPRVTQVDIYHITVQNPTARKPACHTGVPGLCPSNYALPIKLPANDLVYTTWVTIMQLELLAPDFGPSKSWLS